MYIKCSNKYVNHNTFIHHIAIEYSNFLLFFLNNYIFVYLYDSNLNYRKQDIVFFFNFKVCSFLMSTQ